MGGRVVGRDDERLVGQPRYLGNGVSIGSRSVRIACTKGLVRHKLFGIDIRLVRRVAVLAKAGPTDDKRAVRVHGDRRVQLVVDGGVVDAELAIGSVDTGGDGDRSTGSPVIAV